MCISTPSIIRFITLAWFVTLPGMAAIAQPTIGFGNGNELTYNLKKGTYTLKHKATTIIGDAVAEFEIDGVRYRSDEAGKRTWKEESFQDDLGNGKSYLVHWETAPGYRVTHFFRYYEGKDFLVTGLVVSGDQPLQTNYMAPLIARSGKPSVSGEISSISVPFDNDTFIRYRAQSLSTEKNTSSEVGTLFDPTNRNGLIIGSLDQRTWKSAIRSRGDGVELTSLEAWAGYTDVTTTRDSMPHGYVIGDTLRSPEFFLGYFDDWREGMELYAACARVINVPYVRPWQGATPIGWNSWGTIKENLTYDKAVGVADFFGQQLPAFRNNDNTAYIDLDSFWDNMVEGGLLGDFGRLKAFADHCLQQGLQPGIYWAPFTDWGHQGNPGRIAEGTDYPFNALWTQTATGYHDLDGGRALDPTHPGTQQRIRYVIDKLKECGFSMIKIDFLGHAAIESTRFHDPSITTGMQAYRIGMECLSDALDNSMLVYAAISPSLASTRYVHIRRIACDAWKSLEDTEYTLNSVTYGWWQNALYDYIDADHLVFENESVPVNQARFISGLVTGPVILGDDYSMPAPWQNRIKEWLQAPWIKEFIACGETFLPMEAGSGIEASRSFVRHDQHQTWLAAFNYKRQPDRLTLSAESMGLEPDLHYLAEPLFGGQPILFSGHFSVGFETGGANLYRIIAQ